MKTPSNTRIKINKDRHEVFVGGKSVHLAKKEYEILVALSNSKKTMSRGQLLELIWGHSEHIDTRTVDQHLARLRKKIGPGVISTISGFGYRFDA